MPANRTVKPWGPAKDCNHPTVWLVKIHRCRPAMIMVNQHGHFVYTLPELGLTSTGFAIP